MREVSPRWAREIHICTRQPIAKDLSLSSPCRPASGQPAAGRKTHYGHPAKGKPDPRGETAKNPTTGRAERDTGKPRGRRRPKTSLLHTAKRPRGRNPSGGKNPAVIQRETGSGPLTCARQPPAAVASDGETLRLGGSGSVTGALPPPAAVASDGEALRLGGPGFVAGVASLLTAVAVDTAAPAALAMIQGHPVQHCAGKRSNCLARWPFPGWSVVQGWCNRAGSRQDCRRVGNSRLLACRSDFAEGRVPVVVRGGGRGPRSERARVDARHRGASRHGCGNVIRPTLPRLQHGAQETERSRAAEVGGVTAPTPGRGGTKMGAPGGRRGRGCRCGRCVGAGRGVLGLRRG